ncbi:hypothetical protein PACTADRAFT_47590 [Pachysolen tannophilus NRRL Y-2460]|uniref:Small ribosomal subunit protein bS6m n=1 Tax=Pachysolen tannophilus NRRL Y-2460 TaxID=669874 RepID=A0A1E4U167_PACTA|nr:hypothetical protein PACTADRAFT_47590 [Pachysolen tannophilus NRRL Y-2460]
MLYELVGIARITSGEVLNNEAKAVVSTIGKLILQNRGVIRKIYNLGVRPLPRILTKQQEKHFRGSHFIMLFDSSNSVSNEILRSLRNDPRIIRSNLFRVPDDKKLNVLGAIDRVNSKN